jgi:hypothetical protein
VAAIAAGADLGRDMPHDDHKHECCEEVTKLLKTLIEVEVEQAERLGRVSAKLETALCILERISRNTCETLNATDELLERSKERCPPPHHQHCRHEECGHEECGHEHHCRHCGHHHHEHEHHHEREPRCKYEPCERHDEEGGSGVSLSGSADPGRTFGAPYPPAELKPPPPEGRANKHPAPDVPRGPFRGFLVPGDEIMPLDIKSGGGGGGAGGDDPVVFGKFTVYGTDATVKSTTAADISGAESGSVVMATANRYVSYSTDGGNTFTSLDPTTIFDNTADGGFCCDQIVQYAPSIDRFIWLMQFSTGTDGKNRLRIAAASPETVVSSKCTSWTYWDLTSDGLGVTTTAADATAGNHWLDYPNMSIGTNSLYLSVDNVGNGGSTPPTGGRIVVRVALSEIQAASTINYWYTHWENGGVAYASHVSQNTGDEAYWAGNKNNSTLTVFSWNESSTTYFWRDVGVNNWPNATLSSIAADGNDWLTKASSFPRFGVIGATRRGNEVWFAWMASSGSGASGSFNFPNANVQVVSLDPTNNYKRLDQFAIWNNDYAFTYPALATNDRNEVGIALGWGGKTFYANSAVGILGDFVVWYPELSDISTTRWGDYVTARQASPQTSLFAGFGYAILKDSTVTAGLRFDPFYLLFGRNSIINPGGGGDGPIG